jgi:hypothetical protein
MLICNKKKTSVAAFTIAALGIGIGLNALYKHSSVQSIFYNSVHSSQPTAIVAFAGDHARICTAIELQKKYPDLFVYVSGNQMHYNRHGVICDGQHYNDLSNIIFDHAVNTRDNGIRTAEWLRDNDHDSVFLVTSDYHMNRSLFELVSSGYKGDITPVPVETNQQRVWSESLKYVIRLVGIRPPRDYQFPYA